MTGSGRPGTHARQQPGRAVAGGVCPRPRHRPSRPGDGHRESGQSSIELLGMLPLLVIVALALGQLLAAGVARELAGTAAQAGAMALLQGNGDPARAARDAVPSWTHERLEVRVRDRTVRVRLRPPALLPGTASRLTATATADAGPTP